MTEISKNPLRVFLCHASSDKPAVRNLYRQLVKEGVDVWLDEASILPGQDWQVEIPEAVRNSDVIIVCLSNKSITKEGYIQKEISFALDVAYEKPERAIFIIPARLEDCEVPKRLIKWQYVDLHFNGGTFVHKGYEMLIRALHVRAEQLKKQPPQTHPKNFIDPAYNPIEYQPFLIVISGPYGVGKDSVIARMKERGAPYHFVITATTRPRRETEAHGRDYYFVSFDEFARMIEEDELIEYAAVYDEYKGIPKQQVREALQNGKDVVMRLDVQSAEAVRRIAPEAILIFLTAENDEQLTSRLQQKASQEAGAISIRLAAARKELLQVHAFDYIVINRDFQIDDTVDIIMGIINAERRRIRPRRIAI